MCIVCILRHNMLKPVLISNFSFPLNCEIKLTLLENTLCRSCWFLALWYVFLLLLSAAPKGTCMSVRENLKKKFSSLWNKVLHGQNPGKIFGLTLCNFPSLTLTAVLPNHLQPSECAVFLTNFCTFANIVSSTQNAYSLTQLIYSSSSKISD